MGLRFFFLIFSTPPSPFQHNGIPPAMTIPYRLLSHPSKKAALHLCPRQPLLWPIVPHTNAPRQALSKFGQREGWISGAPQCWRPCAEPRQSCRECGLFILWMWTTSHPIQPGQVHSLLSELVSSRGEREGREGQELPRNSLFGPQFLTKWTVSTNCPSACCCESSLCLKIRRGECTRSHGREKLQQDPSRRHLLHPSHQLYVHNKINKIQRPQIEIEHHVLPHKSEAVLIQMKWKSWGRVAESSRHNYKVLCNTSQHKIN